MTKTTEIFVAVKNLSVVWVQAQRPYREAWAKEIADNFDTDKFDPPVISKPNGQGHYHIVEGQHRVGAVKIAFGENEQIKCRMVDAEDPARAAEIFLGINKGRKAIKPVVSFLVSVTAKREPECDINRMVVNLGYQISPNKTDYCINAVNSLLRAYQRQGKAVLYGVLHTLHRTWAGDPAAFQGGIISGYAAFINEYQVQKLNLDRLVVVIQKNFTPGKLLQAGRNYSEQHRVTLAEGMSETLRGKYNFAMKDGQKLRKK
jgi:ParB-like nuclease domain